MTSESTTGNLDGLTGADARCQADAAANLPGTYLAWLSDSQASPSTRFVRATAPYRLPDGLTAAWDWNNRTGSGEFLVHSIDVQADGHTVYHGKIWTNTRRDGASGGINPAHRCDNWRAPSSELRGNYALAIATDDRWTVNASQECDMLGRLYCFQQR